MAEEVEAKVTDTIWSSLAKVGDDTMAVLVANGVIKLTPDANTQFPSIFKVGDTRLTISVTLVNEVTV